MPMQKIEEVVLSSTASITFSNIPNQQGELLLVWTARSDRSSVEDDIQFEFNGNTNIVYRQFIQSAGINNDSLMGKMPAAAGGWPTNYFGTGWLQINNYYKADQVKPLLSRSGAVNRSLDGSITRDEQGFFAGYWNSNAAISSVTFKPRYGTGFVANSQATLYIVTP